MSGAAPAARVGRARGRTCRRARRPRRLLEAAGTVTRRSGLEPWATGRPATCRGWAAPYAGEFFGGARVVGVTSSRPRPPPETLPPRAAARGGLPPADPPRLTGGVPEARGEIGARDREACRGHRLRARHVPRPRPARLPRPPGQDSSGVPTVWGCLGAVRRSRPSRRGMACAPRHLGAPAGWGAPAPRPRGAASDLPRGPVSLLEPGDFNHK